MGTAVCSDSGHGPYTPTLILHGGAGAITRSNLPPPLYHAYRSSLLDYLHSAHAQLMSGASALDAACRAVSLLEDDPLFNCGRGAVFTEKGTIELEASVMVCSVRDDSATTVPVKRGAAVSLIKGTRHPILLAKELLLDGGNGLGKVSTMHCHLSGEEVEEWGWNERGLERKGKEWFWTEKRWKEHLRGDRTIVPTDACEDEVELPSQGTVGAVCMDSWGNLAVATSTGGLTNKKVGRIGDTPTLGAGFWAESWEEVATTETKEDRGSQQEARKMTLPEKLSRAINAGFGDILRDCLPTLSTSQDKVNTSSSSGHFGDQLAPLLQEKQPVPSPQMKLTDPEAVQNASQPSTRRHAVAMSGTGNGDSFLRTDAVRTAAALCRFGARPLHAISLATAVNAVIGPGGEVQQSAGNRWQKTGEGQGGIIGIELLGNERKGNVVFDFNCGGLWRAWIDEQTGKPRVMVFKEDYTGYWPDRL